MRSTTTRTRPAAATRRGAAAVAAPDAPARPGLPWPLGATPDGDGVNFAVFSAHATRIELCLLDPSGARELRRLDLPERTDQVFHGYVPGLRPGQAYGYRAHGRWAPGEGHRFNPARLLLDPNARAVAGRLLWEGPNLVDRLGDPFALDPRDSLPFVPKSVVAAPLPAAPDAERPGTPWPATVLYEAHVRGMTMLHPAVPEPLRGTFAGMAHPAVLDHLARLGVTAVELMPVTALADELRLHRLGLSNHWGYNPVAFGAPEPRLASGPDPAAEFRALVEALHGRGIEVVLDLVFNHTAEGDHLGPTLSLRGLDNLSYYRLDPADSRRYVDDAGCGNCPDLAHPRVGQLVTDSLRHWASFGVDGFRLDLATSLGRDRDGAFRPDAPLLQAIAQDPVLGSLKLIAEPWDIGPGGYQGGGFRPPYAEWNDGFRDAARRFWRGDPGSLPGLATRLLGSADRFEASGRGPWASVNYVAAHDGFTTRDLVTYEHKRNEANGEGNRDGHGDELSSGYGADGETDNPAANAIRLRQRRNLLATVLLAAQGTPMLLMGDEAGRSQGGNNNAYCQDNPTSWYAWEGMPLREEAFRDFVARLIALRRTHPALRRRRFLHGATRGPAGLKDVAWLGRDGREMTAAAWEDPANLALGLLLDGAADPDLGPDGLPEAGDALLLLLNAQAEAATFTLPAAGPGTAWETLLDTVAADDDATAAGGRHRPGAALVLPDRSLRLLRATAGAARRGGRTSPAGKGAFAPPLPPRGGKGPE
jgi:isoamylase